MTQEEKREMEILRSDNVELAKTIESLKRKIGGYKTSNDGYRKKITELQERVEHYKHLDIEGDELYENKIAECDDLKAQLEKKQGFIEQLQERIHEMNIIKAGLESEIVNKNAIIDEMDAEIVRLEKPWWRKIFG